MTLTTDPDLLKPPMTKSKTQSSPADQAQRDLALDPRRSVLVQAPAHGVAHLGPVEGEGEQPPLLDGQRLLERAVVSQRAPPPLDRRAVPGGRNMTVASSGVVP